MSSQKYGLTHWFNLVAIFSKNSSLSLFHPRLIFTVCSDVPH